VLQPSNSEHLSDTIGTLSAKFAQDNSYKLVIVDSILALFRIDYEANELADRQRNVNRFLTDLLAMAQQWNIAVMITNKVIVRQGQGAMPTGGRYFVAHVSTTRVMLTSEDGIRVAKLVDSPDLPSGTARFSIGAAGISDFV